VWEFGSPLPWTPGVTGVVRASSVPEPPEYGRLPQPVGFRILSVGVRPAAPDSRHTEGLHSQEFDRHDSREALRDGASAKVAAYDSCETFVIQTDHASSSWI